MCVTWLKFRKIHSTLIRFRLRGTVGEKTIWIASTVVCRLRTLFSPQRPVGGKVANYSREERSAIVFGDPILKLSATRKKPGFSGDSVHMCAERKHRTCKCWVSVGVVNFRHPCVYRRNSSRRHNESVYLDTQQCVGEKRNAINSSARQMCNVPAPVVSEERYRSKQNGPNGTTVGRNNTC